MNAYYMARAIELAKQGIGAVDPNPLVGAILVKEGVIIGEGYHERYGEAHAEVNAFKNASVDCTGATMYVTLEPCSHYGKTPPCVNAIISHGIAKVVIGMEDPNPLVKGRGVQILRDHGIEVEIGILEDEVKTLNEVFIKYIVTQIPFVVLKSAMTLDGKSASVTGASKWISSEASRARVHQIRHQLSAIMVGVNTVIKDNPSLTTRLDGKEGRNPIRIIVDSKGRIPLDSGIMKTANQIRTILATTDQISSDKIMALESMGCEVLILPTLNERVDLKALMVQLGQMKINGILLEGGSILNFSAIEAGIVDKVMVFIAPMILGGETAKTPISGKGYPAIEMAAKLERLSVSQTGGDVLIEGYIKQ